jgi:hypothetical protein
VFDREATLRYSGRVDDLREKLERVADLRTFLAFVTALAEDRRAATDWEASTIEAYLAAAVAWAEDSEGQPLGLAPEPSWKGFATFLYCGKIYE